MELVSIRNNNSQPTFNNANQALVLEEVKVPDVGLQFKQQPFIEANTQEVSLEELQHNCIIPVFSKDNEKTIAHQEFIDVAYNSVASVYSGQVINAPEIRVSHQIKGRTPDAIHKSAKDLLDHERTQYFERMAFIIRIPSIVETINGNKLSLIVGGVRAYNHENLYSKKGFEKFKFFIGFQNMVCCNMCISTDGFQSEMKVSSVLELQEKMMELIQGYSASKHLEEMKNLSNYRLNEKQFAQLIGKARLYNYLPKEEKIALPELLLNDNHFNAIAKDYFGDKSFCKNEDGSINLWKVYNLLTGANKSSYINTFLDRSVNAFNFTEGLSKAINGDSNYRWFLS